MHEPSRQSHLDGRSKQRKWRRLLTYSQQQAFFIAFNRDNAQRLNTLQAKLAPVIWNAKITNLYHPGSVVCRHHHISNFCDNPLCNHSRTHIEGGTCTPDFGCKAGQLVTKIWRRPNFLYVEGGCLDSSLTYPPPTILRAVCTLDIRVCPADLLEQVRAQALSTVIQPPSYSRGFLVVQWKEPLNQLWAEILRLVEEASQQGEAHQDIDPRAYYRPHFTLVVSRGDIIWTKLGMQPSSPAPTW